MLKTIRLLDKLVLSKNNGNKPASSKNDGNKPALKKNNSNGKVEFDGDSMEHAKKLEKLKG